MLGIIAVLCSIGGLVGTWQVFEKADEPGWKALIPGYNLYTLFSISWDAKYFWCFLVCGFVTLLLRDNTIIGSFPAMATVGLPIVCFYHLSRSFEHGIGFAIGLILLGPIFLMILGLGNSCYDNTYHPF